MTKLEKSIRSSLKVYGPALRAGHYSAPGAVHYYNGGEIGDYIQRVCCDVEDGVVTDIRLYVVGEPMTCADYNGDSCSITEAVCDYLAGNSDHAWDELIDAIAQLVREYEMDD